jgi:hypothetical protein
MGNHCSSHPPIICSSSPNSIFQRVNSADCPGVGSVNDDMIWWNEGSERGFVKPSQAGKKEGNAEYMARRDYQGCGQGTPGCGEASARRELCRYEIQVEES